MRGVLRVGSSPSLGIRPTKSLLLLSCKFQICLASSLSELSTKSRTNWRFHSIIRRSAKQEYPEVAAGDIFIRKTANSALDSTSADRRQEESENCTGQVDVRQQADRRCVGWLCRRGDRRLLACWPADGGRRGGDGSGCERVGRRAVCGRRGRAGRPERPLG